MTKRDYTEGLASTPGYAFKGDSLFSRDRRRARLHNTDIAIAVPKEAGLWRSIRQQAKNINSLMVGRR
jgi:hypothetical protein